MLCSTEWMLLVPIQYVDRWTVASGFPLAARHYIGTSLRCVGCSRDAIHIVVLYEYQRGQLYRFKRGCVDVCTEVVWPDIIRQRLPVVDYLCPFNYMLYYCHAGWLVARRPLTRALHM